MSIVELRWRRYRVPFRRPVATAHGAMTAREGAIVEVVTDRGVTGVGEIAPLPRFGQTLEEALAPLPELAQAVRERPEIDWVHKAWWDGHLPPATRFALETAHCDQDARRFAHRPSSRAVPVNAIASEADDEGAAAAATAAVTAGYGCVKLKVGISETIDEEVNRIALVRHAIGPHSHLRLDANEAWTLDQATAVLGRVAKYGIQYVEQPLHRDDLGGMRRLRQVQPIPVAADEAITDEASVRRVLDAEAADVFVLKPQAIGGGRACLLIAENLGLRARVVVTSAMEAGIGVAASLRIAAMLQPPFECGLATLDLLEDDLIVEAPRIENGVMSAPQGPGLGVELDRAALAKYAVD